MPRVQKVKIRRADSVKHNNGRMLSIFRYLARDGHYLAADTNGEYRVFCDKTHKTLCFDGETVFSLHHEEIKRLSANDLLAAVDGGYAITAAGRAWLRRQLALADAFQEQHQARRPREIDVGEGLKQPAIVNDGESPLAWLATRKDKNGRPMLEPAQFAAGERLRADYYYAGLTARVTASWDPAATGRQSGGRGQNDLGTLTDNVLAARQRVVKALCAVGPELAGILVDVCCHLKGLEEAEKAEGWPQRSGKVVLQLALSKLARHYGLIGGGDSVAGLKRKLQHWGASDYRPEFDASGEHAATNGVHRPPAD